MFIVPFLYVCSTGAKFQLITVIIWYLRTPLEKTNYQRVYLDQDVFVPPLPYTMLIDLKGTDLLYQCSKIHVKVVSSLL